MNFCGCDVILKSEDERFLDRAETQIKKIFEKEFNPSPKGIRKIVERDLGIKKHWLFGWIKD